MKMDNVKTITIAGAGLMGASMAQIFAESGYNVVVYDIVGEALKKGENLISISQRTAVASGEITQRQSDNLQLRIHFTQDIKAFEQCQVLVECIVENLATKQKFWAEISALVSDETVLATNTSGISITEIAKAVKKPERFVGMHWFNPPYIVPLIEVISGEKTSDETADFIYNLSLQIGKKPVRVKRDIKGFLANRLQLAVLREAIHLVECGAADLADVDSVVKYGLGLRYACLGPFEVADFGGLDTFYHISDYLLTDLCDVKEPQTLLAEAYKRGDYGVKTKKGFYDYNSGKDKEAIKRRDSMFIALSKLLYH